MNIPARVIWATIDTVYTLVYKNDALSEAQIDTSILVHAILSPS